MSWATFGGFVWVNPNIDPGQSVKRFMTYIADLIYIMKIPFILAPQGSVTSQDVALALKVYKRSTYRNRVHLEIRDVSVFFAPGQPK
ncbi:hypothetical protein J3R83DRAFT_10546 [Lanmaoa asiatica]|nr:hypothetical protein J3R83DRAFT_10546 [Lanmaoa asiatica]